jgi:nicotinamidase-related amidase
MLLDVAQSVLVLVDYQSRLMPAIDGGDDVVRNALRLAQAAQRLGVPVIGTEQNPDGLGPLLPQLREHCSRVVVKSRFDACADGLLDASPAGRSSHVVAGCEAHVCLLQSALGLRAAGCDTIVVADACGSRQAGNRDAALARLARHGVELVTTEMVLFEWLRGCEHPLFRDVLALIK